MVQYNFKSICVVPSAKDFIDIVLSKTQRKTPTVVHKHYKISRIRQFYMRKVRYTQQNFEEKLDQILKDFPKIDDVHPFYSDLINILYDKDHYKIALGQLNKAKQLISNIGKEYLKLLKFADSLYRCKMLKKAALGRMATLMKRQKDGLEYLESVRQHMARLPSIDPNQPSILISGFPNVGKSSFINQITRADVEVQPYAFTTKSLYVGHTDHNYLKWQVIDTPGILDKPLEERNTIEMQAITALAHIRAIVLYFVDVSETCGYSLVQQIALYNNIQPLFVNKPLMVIANKTDIKSLDDLDEDSKALIKTTFLDQGVPVKPMSALTKNGVIDVKNEACDRLLAFRIEHKSKSKKMELIANRLAVANPKIHNNDRVPFFPPGAIERLKLRAEASKNLPNLLNNDSEDFLMMDEENEEEGGDFLTKKVKETVLPNKKKTERDIEAEMGDDYMLDLQKYYDLPNSDHKYDVIPEICGSKNISDFIDLDIFRKLEEIERDEEAKIESGYYEQNLSDDEFQNPKDVKDLAKKIRTKKKLRILETRLKKSSNKPRIPRKVGVTRSERTSDALQKHMSDLGAYHLKSGDFKNLKRTTLKRHPLIDNSSVKRLKISNFNYDNGESMDTTDATMQSKQQWSLVKKSRVDSKTGQVRSNMKITPRNLMGIKNMEMKYKLDKIAQKSQSPFIMDGRTGEADRHVYDWKPKHLFSGKRKAGKTTRR